MTEQASRPGKDPAVMDPDPVRPGMPGGGAGSASASASASSSTMRAPSRAALRRRSRSATARSAGADRSLVALLGLLLLAAGTGVALLSIGVFGAGRASRPLLDPIVVDALRTQPLLARLVAVGGGLLLAVVGVGWALRSLRPEPRPDLVLDGGPDTTVVVRGPAVAAAVGEQAAALPGVSRAGARMVGRASAPALRLTVWLADPVEGVDVAALLRRLDEEVVTDARTALGVAALPVAVRLELDTAGSDRRVT